MGSTGKSIDTPTATPTYMGTTPMQTSTWCSLVGLPPAENFRGQIEAG